MRRVKFVYNPASGENMVTERLDDIIAVYQRKGYSIVPYRLTFEGNPDQEIAGDLDFSYHHILIAGGVTKSKVWRQIFADVTGYPVVCPIYDVEANMGDVMLAGIGTGLLTYEEVKKWQVLDEKIMPNEENHKKYNEYFRLYKSIYNHLKEDMKDLTKIR